MNKKLSYKGYTTIIQYSNEDKCFYGKLENITDLITFESDTSEDIELHFINTVNTYIKDRKNINELSG